MPKTRTRDLTAWEAVKIVERSRREKELFFELFHEAAKKDPEAAERVRKAYGEDRISFEEAIARFKKIAGKQ